MSPAAPQPNSDWRRFGLLPLGPVLCAAASAFLEMGYHGATVREIARRCGLSVPGMYHHHLTKQDMLVKLLDFIMDELGWRAEAAQAEGGSDPVRRFCLLVENLVLVHTHRRDIAFIGISEMRSLKAPNRARIIALQAAQQAKIDGEVEAAAASGRFATPSPRAASRAVVTMCTATVHWYDPTGPMSPEQIAANYVNFALGLVGYPQARSGERRPAGP